MNRLSTITFVALAALTLSGACGSGVVRVSGRVLNTPVDKLDLSYISHNRKLVKKGWEAMAESGPCGEARADAFYYSEAGQVGLSCTTLLDKDGVCQVKAAIKDPTGQCSGDSNPGSTSAEVVGQSPCKRSLTCRLQLNPAR